jgi:hypothetical protein
LQELVEQQKFPAPSVLQTSPLFVSSGWDEPEHDHPCAPLTQLTDESGLQPDGPAVEVAVAVQAAAPRRPRNSVT